MTPRRWAWLLVVAVVVYFLLAGTRGWALLTSGDTAGVFLGAAVLVLPVIGAWVVWREVAFGYAMQAMGADLAACGDLPIDDFARTVEADPHDWRGWYRFGLAQDAARDRRRARAAMREALRLRQASTPEE